MRWIDLENRKPTDTDIPNWTPWTQEKWKAWLAKSQQLNNKLTTLHTAGDLVRRNKFIDDNSNHWSELKPWLLALSGGKCWFSDTRDNFNHYDVEHFRPKKEAKNLDSSVVDGYWWLAFDYMNFRICGNVGNRKKGGWFPLQNGSLRSTFTNRCEESEDAYLLDPIDPDDWTLLAYNEEGNAIPTPKASEKDKCRVTQTVERLKLNDHPALIDARRKVWAHVTRLINKYNKAKSLCATNYNPAEKQKIREIAIQIKDLTKGDANLSVVARWCIFFCNDPQLNRLVA